MLSVQVLSQTTSQWRNEQVSKHNDKNLFADDFFRKQLNDVEQRVQPDSWYFYQNIASITTFVWTLHQTNLRTHNNEHVYSPEGRNSKEMNRINEQNYHRN